MLELNKVHKVDVMEGMRQLEDNSIDLIITSPPYNKAGLNGHKKPILKDKRHAAKQNNCEWIDFDLFDEYINMTNNRIKN